MKTGTTPRFGFSFLLFVSLFTLAPADSRLPAAEEQPPAWATAHLQPPLDKEQTRDFSKKLARFVFENHLKKDAASEQRGMVYEYFDTTRKGEIDQFVQGEALDTMHDGAWLAAALVNAYRATGDEFYKEFLTQWQLPFYLKMLNHSDELFTAKRNDARPDAAPWGKEWEFQEGEKGFVPYFWDDGGSVSLERRRDKNPLAIRPSVDHLAGKPNPHFLLDGYSLGMSNHMAQDLGVMVQLAWLLLKDSTAPADQKLADETALAARHLHEGRVRHHGNIPMCVAPAALANADAELMKHVPKADNPNYWNPNNHYVRAMYSFQPGQRAALPGFADDQQYSYYHGIAQSGGVVPRPLAFKVIYDAFTEPLLYRSYSDDAPVPAGINRFDLHPNYCVDGKHVDYRSDRKGPHSGPRPIGSRMGPQNMICSGWGVQLLRAYPGIWEERYRRDFADDLRVFIHDPAPRVKRQADAGAKTEATLAGVHLSLASTRDALSLEGTFGGDEVVIKLFSRPDAQGTHAVVTLNKDGTAVAVNGAGEKLLIDAGVKASDGGTSRFTVRLPYTVVKEQRTWANGIEHGRYSIAIGDAIRNFYLASREEQVAGWLEHELAGGLRTWQALFEEKDYIPTGLNAGFIWDQLSDSGGYAHLISAAAQWLHCLEGQRDWETHRVPNVSPPR